MQKRFKLLTLYSIGHFAVDLACAFLIISLAVTDTGIGSICFLMYNFCAFAMQMPVGLIVDKLNRNAFVALVGFVLVLSAFVFYPVPLASAVLLGMGNCLYHVGGGIDVLNFSDTKQWMLGVYVSPGALGLFVGTILAQNRLVSISVGFAAILVVFILVSLGIYIQSDIRKPSENAPPTVLPCGSAPVISFIALFLVVVIRSYVGVTMSFPWKTGAWSIAVVLGLALGKAVGGLVADRFGAIRSSVITLLLSGLLFVFSKNPICGTLAVFLFNMTMPLTLFEMARIFPGAKGFAFGTLTFALFIGYIPSFLSVPDLFGGNVLWYAVVTLLSLAFMVIGLLFGKRK